jgi:hypothetical protein
MGQSRPLTFPLHRMIMSSLEQQARMESRIALLEAENAALRSQGGKPVRKLTLTLLGINTLGYHLVDQSQLKPRSGRIPRELFLNSAQNLLPSSGVWQFRIFLTACAANG